MQEQISFETLPVLNLQTVESIRKISSNSTHDVLTNLIQIFLEDSPKRITSILNAANNKNSKVFYESAHSFRSSSASIGAERLSKLCQFLEQNGRSGIIPEPYWCNVQLHKKYSEVEAKLLLLLP
ncbi:Hpt domain-containing protein [Leptothoe sp. ISB3NOV94-8A]